MDQDLFNYAPMEAFSHLSEILKDPLPLSALNDPDLFYSWTVIAREREPDGKRLLLQYPDGGLCWIHVDESDLMTDSSMISDEEAREIWPRLILQTSAELRAKVERGMQPGVPLDEALSQTFGESAAEGILELGEEPGSDGSLEKRLLMPGGGVLRVWLTGAGAVKRSEIVDGQAAWAYVQPVIDEDGDDDDA